MNSPVGVVLAVFGTVCMWAFFSRFFSVVKTNVDYRRKHGTKAAKAVSMRVTRDIQDCEWRLNGFKSPEDDMWKGRP
jgi:hypothetical protein